MTDNNRIEIARMKVNLEGMLRAINKILTEEEKEPVSTGSSRKGRTLPPEIIEKHMNKRRVQRQIKSLKNKK